jgi:hypothetical protein
VFVNERGQHGFADSDKSASLGMVIAEFHQFQTIAGKIDNQARTIHGVLMKGFRFGPSTETSA